MSYTTHKEILQTVGKVIKHHKELTKAKGELFNIYEILNLKTKEVRTHSAFIAELLNPKGTHQMGNAFLEAFINLIKDKVQFKPNKDFNTEDVNVFVEYYIGKRDDEKKVGGRIDILFHNHLGQYISIENKIDADDQEVQIERYCNYNKENNTVIYLSKFGDEPDDDSKGELVAGTEFYIISYQNEILKWLEICQTLSFDQPILRESIKQYKILVQKMTNTLGNKQNMELKEIILNNLEEARQIANNYENTVNTLKSNFRSKVFQYLKDEENEKFKNLKFSERNPIVHKYATIWFHNDNAKYFGVESFSGKSHLDGNLFVGIHIEKTELDGEYNSINKWWKHHQVLTYNNDQIVNLSKTEFLQEISNEKQLDRIAKEVAKQIVDFVVKHKHLVY